jgi:hypothetical protein
MKSILIAGGSGLIGKRLTDLLADSYQIKVLTRKEIPSTEKVKYYKWDTDKGILEKEALEVDVIINLAGEGIAEKRWTKERKESLISSRIKPNQLIAKKLAEYKIEPKLFIGASAIGFYGNRADEILTEESRAGQGFLSECSVEWENSYKAIERLSERFCMLRIGIVLSSKGGALPELLMTSPLGFLSYFGNGSMYYSWIHIDDVCNIVLQSIKDDRYSGIINTVSPIPMTNREMVNRMAKIYGKISVPAPSFGVRVMLGEMADVVLNSTRVVPKKLESYNHKFLFSDIEEALKNLKEHKY